MNAGAPIPRHPPLPVSLWRALRVVVRADSDPARTLLFDSLAARSPLVRVARWASHGPLRGTFVSVALVAGYGVVAALACVAPPTGTLWMLPLFDNDRRQLDAIAALLAPGEVVGSLRWPRRLASAPFRRAARGLVSRDGRRFWRIVRRLVRRHGFLVACRSSLALASALVARASLSASRVRGVLVSSDYNSEAVGVVWAARRAGLVTVYASHAPTHDLSPPLAFSLSILDGPAALDAYRRKGPVTGRWVYKGAAGTERPLDAGRLSRRHPTIGVFLPKEVDWPAVSRLVGEAQTRFAPERILVRRHPNAQRAAALEGVLGDATGIEECPAGAALDADARRCDWVIADRNSSVGLTVLRAGVPVVTVPGLAVFPEERADLYGLVADRVVPPACARLADLDPGALAEFYAGDWPERFARHDASYGRDRQAVDDEVRAALRSVLDERAAPGA